MKRDNALPVKVTELDEEGNAKNVETIFSSKTLGSNSSAAPRESCTNNQKKKNPFVSLNIEMIVKMCT